MLIVGTSAQIPAPVVGYRVEGIFDLGSQGSVRYIRFAPERGVVPVLCTAAILPQATFRSNLAELHERSKAYNAVNEMAIANDAVVAVNGGFFVFNTFTPDGLLIVDGRRIGQARPGVGGIVALDSIGRLSISGDTDPRGALNAVQSQPLLVLPGGKMGMRSETGLLARRSFIAVSGDFVIAGITSPVTLYHLADVMIEYPDAFGLPRIDAALNLTGDATSAFYARLQEGTTLERRPTWPNRDVLLFTRRYNASSESI
jgi:Phosphodiester glycosidase